MRREKSFRSEAAVITAGLATGESPRWHDGKLWVSDWGAQEILAIDSQGHRQAMGRTSFEQPVCINWLLNGCMLIVAGRENRVMRQEANGSLVQYADLRNISDEAWNEIVVDGRGNAYINGGSGVIALVKKDGSVRQVAGDIAFPNGMAITPNNKTLIIAESYGRKLQPLISTPTGISRIGESGPIWGPASPTASASMRSKRSGTPTCRTNVVYASGKAVKCCRRSAWTAVVSPACSVEATEEHCSSSPPSGAGWTKLRKSREIAPDRYCRSQPPHQAPDGREVGLIQTPTTWRIPCGN
jgi:hypothetical protein